MGYLEAPSHLIRPAPLYIAILVGAVPLKINVRMWHVANEQRTNERGGTAYIAPALSGEPWRISPPNARHKPNPLRHVWPAV
jgi:hypothetical protein